ncbi:MAG: ABC transporter permease [Planctomycetes bacterium]|nr:ABC transporter permease [Planctomycetota bacterium]
MVIIGNVIAHTEASSYTTVFSSPRALAAIRLSLLCATVSACLGLLFAVPVAHLLARREFPGKIVIDTLLDVPIVLSPVALGTALLLTLNSTCGKVIGDYFTFAVPGIVLAQFTVVVALGIRTLKAVFEEIPPRYEQVARFLGHDYWGSFFRVTLPMARSGIIASFVLMWARAIGEFGATITLAGAVSGKTETIPSAIYLGLAEVNLQETLVYVLLLVFVALTALMLARLPARWMAK